MAKSRTRRGDTAISRAPERSRTTTLQEFISVARCAYGPVWVDSSTLRDFGRWRSPGRFRRTPTTTASRSSALRLRGTGRGPGRRRPGPQGISVGPCPATGAARSTAGPLCVDRGPDRGSGGPAGQAARQRREAAGSRPPTSHASRAPGRQGQPARRLPRRARTACEARAHRTRTRSPGYVPARGGGPTAVGPADPGPGGTAGRGALAGSSLPAAEREFVSRCRHRTAQPSANNP